MHLLVGITYSQYLLHMHNLSFEMVCWGLHPRCPARTHGIETAYRPRCQRHHINKLYDLNIDPLVDRALAFVIHHTNISNFICIMDVGATVRLKVKTNDLDSPHL